MSTPSKSIKVEAGQPLVVWRLLDGKAGHEAQTSGLVQALSRLCRLECHDVQVPARRVILGDWIRGWCRFGEGLPDPQLLLGAGQKTHMALLAARRARGGKAIVLMRPSLPQCWFDLCLVPAHDAPRAGANLVVTQGVLNPIRRAESALPDRGLILIGGPSKHYRWDAEAMLEQIKTVVQESMEVGWTLTTSRRTPPEAEAALMGLKIPNLKVVPVAETASGWVEEKLQDCGIVWVSEDSVSMIYEALTAGAQVGLLEVPAKGNGSRVGQGVASLIQTGRVLRFAKPLPDLNQQKQLEHFDESTRCATYILENLIP